MVRFDRVDFFSRNGCKDFSLLRLCVFFTACQQKKGAPLVPILALPTNLREKATDRAFVLERTATISPKHVENLTENVAFFTRFSSLRSRVTTDAPYTTLLPGWPSHRKDPLSATFNMNLSTHLCFAFIQIGLIDPQTKCVIIRLMLARNDLTGVFLDRLG